MDKKMKVSIEKPLDFSLRLFINNLLEKIMHEDDAWMISEKLPLRTVDNLIYAMLKLFQKKDFIIIESHDVWSVDSTLAKIIVPLLKEYRNNLTGYPVSIDLKDVPKELRDEEDMSKAWEYIVDEMIWAFSQKDTDWENQFYVLRTDIDYKEINIPIKEELWAKNDKKGHDKYYRRIQKGYKLFGRYYDNLWT